MKRIGEFLYDLRRSGIKLWEDAGRLRFYAPKDKLTPELRDELRKRKAEILLFWKKNSQLGEQEDRPIEPVSRDQKLPLSFAQRRLWFMNAFDKSSTYYNLKTTMRLEGHVQVATLERCFAALLQRHEVMRSLFALEEDEPYQVIPQFEPPAMPVIDISACEQDPVDLVTGLEDEVVNRPFDLEHGPLIRFTLVKLGDGDYAMIVVIHHIIFDGWSMGILFRELAALYKAFAVGRIAPLPPLPVQYADFAYWQRQVISGEELKKQIEYWQTVLKGAPALLELPLDHARPSTLQTQGDSVPFFIEPSDVARLRRLVRGEDATLFMGLFAVFAVLLARYSNQQDVVIGTPIANRNRKETEGLIGFFVNTLALRCRFDRSLSFRDFMQRVRMVHLEAHVYQDLPFEQIVETMNPDRNLAHTPIFQVTCVFHNTPPGELKIPGVHISPLTNTTTSSQFDLHLSLIETQRGLHASLDYNSSLFEAATVTQLTRHYRQLLSALLEQPEQPVLELPFLNDEERQQLLESWNGERSKLTSAPLASLFENQVARRPEAPALLLGGDGAPHDRQISYGVLDQRANQLAHFLAEHGIGAGAVVAICLPASIETIVAMVATLKIGAIYLPLDPDNPQERFSFMLQDSGAIALLSLEHIIDALPAFELGFMQVFPLDSEWERVAACADHDPPPRGDDGLLAYTIYTSGSTGNPKAVAVPQRAIKRLVRNTNYVAIEDDDRIGQMANPAFDAVTFEIWGSLLNGACLVFIPLSVALEPRRFAAFLRQRAITILFTTTALFNRIVEEEPRAYAPLRTLLFGGEAVNTRWVRQALSQGPPRHLLHVYGPTENTTFSSWYPVPTVSPDANTVPIGFPLTNSTVYILDPFMQLAPPGVVGEIFLGGEGLAVGYYQRSALTARHFVPQPSWGPAGHDPAQNGARLYRSGDLGRFLENGAVEFIGRVDHQIKLRGFRIELGEIEAALFQHAEVEQCLVTVHSQEGGDKRLVAYLQPACSDQPPRAEQLRLFLADKLPEYMLPQQFVMLAEMPLNANGKIDRLVLPDPVAAATESTSATRLPRDEVELQLIQIWEELFQIRPIQVGSNFFDLGGHSLLAIHLVSQIKRRFGVDLPLADLFRNATIEALATHLKHEAGVPEATPLVCIQPGRGLKPLFFFHPAGGNILSYMDLTRELGSDIPVFGVQHPGLADDLSFDDLESLAGHYRDLIDAAHPQGNLILGGWSSGGALALEVAQQFAQRDRAVDLVVAIDTFLPGQGTVKRSSDAEMLVALAGDYFAAQGVTFDIDSEEFGTLETQDRIDFIIDEAIDRGILSAATGRQRFQRLWQVFLENVCGFDAYRAEPYQGDIALFTAADNSENAVEIITRLWSEIAHGDFHHEPTPGNHQSMMQTPATASLARGIEALYRKMPSEIADEFRTKVEEVQS